MYTDTIARKVTPKVNRVKGKDAQVGMVVPMRRVDPELGTCGDFEWREIVAIRPAHNKLIELASADGWVRRVNGHEFVQVHG